MDPQLAVARVIDSYVNDAQNRAQMSVCRGTVEVIGPGEAMAKIMFPIEFTSKPHMTFGYELMSGSPIPAGSLPRMNAMAWRWGTEKRSQITDHYKWCELVIVFEAPALSRGRVMWRAEAEALV